MAAKVTSSKKKPAVATLKQVEEMKAEVERLRERENILLIKLDRTKNRLDWAFRHPIYFALGRIYHQNIKRDQKNVKG